MNYRLKIINGSDLLDITFQEVTNTSHNGGRTLLLLDAQDQEIDLSGLASHAGFDFFDSASGIDRADRISAILGSERQIAFVQMGARPDLGLIAAIAGTITAGGVFVLATHCAGNSEHSYSARRLITLAKGFAKHWPHAVQIVDTALHRVNLSVESLNATALATRLNNAEAIAEQARLLEQAISHLRSTQTSCIAIVGRRGRGKSVLMARLAQYLADRGEDIRITAINQSALSSWHWHTRLASEQFVSPEAAASATGNVLLVDEAASLPLATTEQFLANYRHVVFSTTVEGYEAGGRALEIRLLSDHVGSIESLLRLEPTMPWRWDSEDTLELFVSALLLNRPATKTQELSGDVLKWREARRISQAELVKNEPLLASIYTLLHNTHYQTSSKDLEHLLDAPSVQIWVQQVEEQAVAVLLLELEGEIKPELYEPIVCKKRRLSNQLLPQLLAQSANTSQALHQRYGRVLRIAVLPACRRMGIATELLQTVTEHTELDALGASFASDTGSRAFWKSNDYREFHSGYRNNPRTSKRSIAVMRCFNPLIQCTLNDAARVHDDNEQTEHATAKASQSTNISDHALLKRFANGQRSLHDTRAALHRLALTHELPITRDTSQSRKRYELILRQCVKQLI